ncbi:hypothetical protein SOVF_169380 [Spinacia oleracea]|nr:hypothetical protein SOVF_169380 [Spinacia oleracea]
MANLRPAATLPGSEPGQVVSVRRWVGNDGKPPYLFNPSQEQSKHELEGEAAGSESREVEGSQGLGVDAAPDRGRQAAGRQQRRRGGGAAAIRGIGQRRGFGGSLFEEEERDRDSGSTQGEEDGGRSPEVVSGGRNLRGKVIVNDTVAKEKATDFIWLFARGEIIELLGNRIRAEVG